MTQCWLRYSSQTFWLQPCCKKSLQQLRRAFKKYQWTHKSLQNPENIREATRRHSLISHLCVQKEISNRRFPGEVSYTCSSVNSKADGSVPANLAASSTGRTGAQPGLTMSVGLSKCCTNTWLSSCSRIHLQHPPGEPYSCLGKRQILGITSIRVFTYCRMVPWSCWRHREVTLECQVSWHWFWKRLVVDGSTSDSRGWNLSWSPGRTCLIWISLKYKIQPKCMESECFYSFLPKNKSQLRGFSASKYSLLCLHCLQLKSKTRLKC